MNTITWKYGKPIEQCVLEAVQKRFKVYFDEDYAQCVLHNDGGRPVPNAFDFSSRKEAVFHRLLSLKEDNPNGLFRVLEAIGDRLPAGYIPFAADPFGNYLCFRFPADTTVTIYFWDHEKAEGQSLTLVCNSFKEFLSMLY